MQKMKTYYENLFVSNLNKYATNLCERDRAHRDSTLD